MFSQFVKNNSALERYRNGLFAQERHEYLTHLLQRGYGKARLIGINTQLLAIARYLQISTHRRVTKVEVSKAADIWMKERRQRSSRLLTAAMARIDFIAIASNWLRFLGWLDEPRPALPFADQVEEYLLHLREDGGLADATIRFRRVGLEPFFRWLAARGRVIATVTTKDISEYFSAQSACAWKRSTVAHVADSLRSFFRYAASRSWCPSGIAATIDKPRLYSYEPLPQGPSWEDVRRLIMSLSDDNHTHIRNRAIVLLLAVYGFRVGEVSKLMLNDIDWETERIHLWRSKQRKTQEYPLTPEVGAAILRYLKEVRPRSSCRELFLTLRAPHRPLSGGSLSARVQTLVRGLGMKLPHYGPHALRHACATHLLAQGLSLKQIGDHLGHRSAESTRIYAKVDLRSLRQVADQTLSDLTKYSGQQNQNVVPNPRLALLREVGNLRLGGVL
jgi:site-specific recombinase XerD